MGAEPLVGVVDFKGLTPEQSKLYDEVAVETQEEYNRLVGSFYDQNDLNRNWYFSSIASRNPHQSKLFERCCIISFIQKHLTPKGSLKYEIFIYD